VRSGTQITTRYPPPKVFPFGDGRRLGERYLKVTAAVRPSALMAPGVLLLLSWR